LPPVSKPEFTNLVRQEDYAAIEDTKGIRETQEGVGIFLFKEEQRNG